MPMWLEDNAPDCDVVVSTRIRLARNLSGVPFTSCISNENDIERVHDSAKQSLLISPEFNYMRLTDMSEIQRRALIERHIISSELSSKKSGGLITSSDESLSVMIMEEDHYRLQSLASGLSLGKAYAEIDRLDNMLAAGVDYAFDEQLGFLTSCLTNAGTGLRASLMLHLPALTAAKGIARITPMIGKVGMTVRGAFGEGSMAQGAFYQISNQITLGVTENEILSRLLATAGKVIDYERSTRREMHKNLGVVLEDRIWRAIGVLQNARRMGAGEAQRMISDVAFGVSLGIFKGASSSDMYRLMMDTRPSVIAEKYGQNSPQNRDVLRANILRDFFNK